MDVLLTIIFAIFFLILFPLGELARVDLVNNIAITGVDIGVGSILLIGIIDQFIRRKKTKFVLLKPILIFLVVCLVSLLVNISQLKQTEFFVAFLYLFRFTAYAGLYFVVSTVMPDVRKKIVLYMFFSGGVILLGGYIQFFFYPSLRNLSYLGWDVHLYRMFGSFLDPNFLGAFFVLYLLFLFSFIFSRDIKNNKFLFITSQIFMLGTIIGIMLTYSRSAYIMCVVALITFFILQKPSKRIVYAVLLLFIVAVISYFGFTKYSEGTNLLRVNSSKARITTSQNALLIFQRNPFLGVGFNAYRYAQNKYGFIYQNKKNVNVDHGGAGSDNSFLFVLATTGSIGFLAYMFLLWKICWQEKHTKGKTFLKPVIISSIIALSLNAFFINSLFYPFILIWVWILIGLGENVDKSALVSYPNKVV